MVSINDQQQHIRAANELRSQHPELTMEQALSRTAQRRDGKKPEGVIDLPPAAGGIPPADPTLVLLKGLAKLELSIQSLAEEVRDLRERAIHGG